MAFHSFHAHKNYLQQTKTSMAMMLFLSLLLLTSLAQSQEEDVPPFFRLLEGGLSEQPDAKAIPFQADWLRYNRDIAPEHAPVPSELVAPSWVRVYNFESTTDDIDLRELAHQTQGLVDAELTQHGAMLFRNMPLDSAKKFAQFWESITWDYFRRIDPFYGRREVEGIHLAPKAYPKRLVTSHNEQAYNPKSPEKVLFYVLEPAAEGGETLLLRNHELTANIDPWIIDFIKKDGYVAYHHWILYDRTETDDQDKHAKSWQHKTGTEDRDEAIRVLLDRGFNESGISIDEEGTMRLVNNHTNFVSDNGQDLWLASLTLDVAKRPNGESLPFELYRRLEIAEWNSNYAFKLQKGDLLFLDNFQVAHGRLPYTNGERTERQLLTTYA
jgi:hypothetical protein